MQATKTNTGTPAKNIARPLAHLLRPMREGGGAGQGTPHLPKDDTSVNQEVANVAVTGYN